MNLIPLQGTYLFGSLLFLILYLILFLWRKDLRKEMLLTGSIMSIFIYVGCYAMCTYDWWQPFTITGTRVGVEDLLFGFSLGGVTAVIYDAVLGKHYSKHSWKKTTSYLRFSFIFAVMVVFGVGLYLIGVKSFHSYYITTFLGSLFLWHVHPSLVNNSLLSGILTVLVAIPIYWAMNVVTPGWIESTYLWHSISGETFLTIPIEEIYYYFFTGTFFGPMYEYLKRID